MSNSICKFLAVIFLLLSVSASFNSKAQSRDSLMSFYNNRTIHSYGPSFVKGGQQIKFHDLKTEFTKPETQDLYKRAKTNRVWSRVLTGTSLAALATSAILRYNSKSKGGSLAFGAAGVVLNLSSYQLRKQSHEKLDQALWLHNRAVLFDTPQ